MIEIVIAVILQVTTIINGVGTDKEKADQKAKDEKVKQEQPINSQGGSGNWND